MSSITITGTGTMARVLATRALAGGHGVQILGRDATRAAELADLLGGEATAGTVGGTAPTGELVVLAVPYAAAAPVVRAYGDALAGRVVVDLTNPFAPGGFTALATPAGSSAAQEIAAAAPAGAHVVKAFNTLFSGVLASGQVEGRPADVFVAGDDPDAKARVSAFAESLGLRPLDAGGLAAAHWLEGAGLLVAGQAARAGNFAMSIKILG